MSCNQVNSVKGIEFNPARDQDSEIGVFVGQCQQAPSLKMFEGGKPTGIQVVRHDAEVSNCSDVVLRYDLRPASVWSDLALKDC